MLRKEGTNSTRILDQLYIGAYQPKDIKIIPYIDQLIQNKNGNNIFNIKSSIIINQNIYESSNKMKFKKTILNQNIFNRNNNIQNKVYSN